MRILISDNGKIPAFLYGGTERVIWYLGKELVKMGHQVVYLVPEGSHCPFAKIIPLDKSRPVGEQIPGDTDIAHFHYPINEEIDTPLIFTNHGNRNNREPFHRNTVFVSSNHAARYHSNVYIHNGLDWSDYNKPDFRKSKDVFHFLGNAAWRVKNLRGAIDIINSIPGYKLDVLGGKRFNFKMGIRLTFNPKIRFYGMIGGENKFKLLNRSNGLLFPVLWHEPFGLALIESMYYGCPVFGTPYGSLPEIVTNEAGYLSDKRNDLIEALKNYQSFNPEKISEYAKSQFNSGNMALSYLKLYERVIAGEMLNPQEPSLIDVTPKYLPWH